MMNGKVLLKRDQAVEKTEGGLFVPGSDKEKINMGMVVAAGDDLKISEGAKIAFRRGYDLSLEGKDYTVVEQNDILVVVN